MTRPVATLPAAANDGRPSRPVYFQTRASAAAYAARCAMHGANGGTYRTPCRDVYQAADGSVAFLAYLAAPGDDYAVREVSLAEVERMAQGELRTKIAYLYQEAERRDRAAHDARPGSCFERIHRECARMARDEARELELGLTLSAVRVAS